MSLNLLTLLRRRAIQVARTAPRTTPSRLRCECAMGEHAIHDCNRTGKVTLFLIGRSDDMGTRCCKLCGEKYMATGEYREVRP